MVLQPSDDCQPAFVPTLTLRFPPQLYPKEANVRAYSVRGSNIVFTVIVPLDEGRAAADDAPLLLRLFGDDDAS